MLDRREDAARERTLELNLHHGERAHDKHYEYFCKANKATIGAGQLAMRTAVLVNGGAAVSVLAFIGNLVNQGKLTSAEIADVASSLMSFALGVAAAGAAMALTYFSEFCAAASLSGYVTKWEHPYVALGSRSRFWGLAANTFNFLAIAAGLASLALFIFGMFDVRDSIIRLGR